MNKAYIIKRGLQHQKNMAINEVVEMEKKGFIWKTLGGYVVTYPKECKYCGMDLKTLKELYPNRKIEIIDGFCSECRTDIPKTNLQKLEAYI